VSYCLLASPFLIFPLLIVTELISLYRVPVCSDSRLMVLNFKVQSFSIWSRYYSKSEALGKT
jgi:hypothetical protein